MRMRLTIVLVVELFAPSLANNAKARGDADRLSPNTSPTRSMAVSPTGEVRTVSPITAHATDFPRAFVRDAKQHELVAQTLQTTSAVVGKNISINVKRVVDVSAEMMWKALDDFEYGKFMNATADTYSSTGGDVGAVRTLTSMGPTKIVERLLKRENTTFPKSFTYAMIAPHFGSLPISAYQVRVEVAVSGQESSIITYNMSQTYLGDVGEAEDKYIATFEGLMGSWIDAAVAMARRTLHANSQQSSQRLSAKDNLFAQPLNLLSWAR